ncbi:oxaloacetate decarboxylase [Pseudomonas taeanensis MS-3]|uniref:Probable oxaloacetate decarboxylase gamma chain n=1 Tax=Pseudomonas taeanensis MS-3 TaxID=1395571 RepID=A0A0A1YLZ7_9PSED|nr:OadG family transporter subunit [Pseudomonas taeanensis]KFX70126.1 oxaloacetate decarboxylase [Pseudomonas taeanensis MS-3]
MTPSQLLLEGVELMLFGMGSVFIFLVLLILAIRVMARLIERFAPAAPVRASVAPLPVKVAGHEPEPDVLAAIQSAIHQHRARRG